MNRSDALAEVPALTISEADLDDLADRIAQRLAQYTAQYTDAKGLAKLLAVSVDHVYAHADELGALRIGSVLRFNVATAERHAQALKTPPPAPATVARPRATQRRSAVELLPIKAGDV